MTTPNYSPRLKRIAEEIKAILRANDVAGMIVLHTPEIIGGVDGSPGAGEYVLELTPSYSAIEWNATRDGVNIKGHRKHYGGDGEKRDKVMRDTLNMLSILSSCAGKLTMNVIDLSERADAVWNAEHGPSTDTHHQAPLN